MTVVVSFATYTIGPVVNDPPRQLKPYHVHGCVELIQPLLTVQYGPPIDTYRSASAARSARSHPVNSGLQLTMQLDDQVELAAGNSVVSWVGKLPESWLLANRAVEELHLHIAHAALREVAQAPRSAAHFASSLTSIL